MVLVVGSTGMVGSEICQRLTRQGEKVRALVRATSSSDKVAFLRGCGVEVFVGDLKNTGSLALACQGVDAVISTGPLPSPRRRETRLDRSMMLDNCTCRRCKDCRCQSVCFCFISPPIRYFLPAGRGESARRARDRRT